eukprot:5556063-Alexandrium_andersonii.AAC.1
MRRADQESTRLPRGRRASARKPNPARSESGGTNGRCSQDRGDREQTATLGRQTISSRRHRGVRPGWCWPRPWSTGIRTT